MRLTIIPARLTIVYVIMVHGRDKMEVTARAGRKASQNDRAHALGTQTEEW